MNTERNQEIMMAILLNKLGGEVLVTEREAKEMSRKYMCNEVMLSSDIVDSNFKIKLIEKDEIEDEIEKVFKKVQEAGGIEELIKQAKKELGIEEIDIKKLTKQQLFDKLFDELLEDDKETLLSAMLGICIKKLGGFKVTKQKIFDEITFNKGIQINSEGDTVEVKNID